MLPAPTWTFTITSIHDNTTLDCRIYHPPELPDREATSEPQGPKKGAIIAHPYAPLGGCQDDPIVSAAAVEVLKQGFVVGTFNFRGAGGSKGKTSWTGRPEVDDYISFTGFVIYYLHFLRPPDSRSPARHSHTTSAKVVVPDISPQTAPSDSSHTTLQGITLILGGYSYGSLITTHLPTTDVILSRFSGVANGSAAAEIITRAVRLSGQWSNEAQPDSLSRARSGEIGVEIPTDEVPPPADLPSLKTFYLLISPLLPPVSMLATMFSMPAFLRGASNEASPQVGNEDTGRLVCYNTLAIYGDKDIFSSERKLRKWGERLAGERDSKFRFREVCGAGHFWREDGVEHQMRAAIRKWVQDVAGG